MKIVHVDTSMQWRGGQRQLELLTRGLAGRGHEQVLLCVPGSPVSRLGLPQVRAYPGTDPRSALSLRKLEWDVLAAHTSHAHQVCVLAGARPVVHRRVDFPVSGGFKYGRALGYVCVSDAVRRILAGVVSEERMVVVHDGVEPLSPMPPAELGEGRIVLAVGALVDHKDHATLDEAARGLDARVLVAGEGPLNDHSHLELLGQRDDVAALFARADVFVHPSKEEGLGQVVVEALHAGVPVVATTAGGLPEVLAGVGLLVPPEDPDALRTALRGALAGAHPPIEAGRARAREFSVEAMVEGTERAYRHFAERPCAIIHE